MVDTNIDIVSLAKAITDDIMESSSDGTYILGEGHKLRLQFKDIKGSSMVLCELLHYGVTMRTTECKKAWFELAVNIEDILHRADEIMLRQLAYTDLHEGQKVYVEYDKENYAWGDDTKDMLFNGIETVGKNKQGELTLVDAHSWTLSKLSKHIEEEGVRVYEIAKASSTKEVKQYTKDHEMGSGEINVVKIDGRERLVLERVIEEIGVDYKLYLMGSKAVNMEREDSNTNIIAILDEKPKREVYRIFDEIEADYPNNKLAMLILENSELDGNAEDDIRKWVKKQINTCGIEIKAEEIYKGIEINKLKIERTELSNYLRVAAKIKGIQSDCDISLYERNYITSLGECREDMVVCKVKDMDRLSKCAGIVKDIISDTEIKFCYICVAGHGGEVIC